MPIKEMSFSESRILSSQSEEWKKSRLSKKPHRFWTRKPANYTEMLDYLWSMQRIAQHTSLNS